MATTNSISLCPLITSAWPGSTPAASARACQASVAASNPAQLIWRWASLSAGAVVA